MIIHNLPPFLQHSFFSPLADRLSVPQFRHLWSLTLAMVLTLRASKLVHLSAVTPRAGHRTRAGAFLSVSDVDAPALLHDAAAGLLSALKPQAGDVIHLILDSNLIEKRGKKMAYVASLFDHKDQRYIRGHVLLLAAVTFKGITLPWRIELWKPKGVSGGRFIKLTSLAAQMIRDFEPPAGVKVRVLFDSFYLCPQTVNACKDRGFYFFSVAKKNRWLTSANGKRRQLRDLAPGLLRHRGRNVRMKRSRGRHTPLRLASIDGRLKNVGTVRVVISKRPRCPFKTTIAIVTNEMNLRPREIQAIYQLRWNVEVLLKELHCDLGLGDYQMIAKDGIIRHLHVCCLAHLLLTHHTLERAGAKALKNNKTVPIPPMSQRLHLLRTRIAADQLATLVKGTLHAKLPPQLHDWLLAA